jgi:heme exporter protein C
MPGVEVVVVDQSDSYDTRRLLAREAPSVRIVASEPRGLAAARNIGVAHAQGETIAFTDDDCEVRPGWLDAMKNALARDERIGLVFGTVGGLLGAIWGRPTWGGYWTWDPRLTTAAILLVAYMGYMALRRFVEDPEKRAVWSSVVGIIAAVDLPIIWFSVKWWRSLHQVQSSPKTVDPAMQLPLRISAYAFLTIAIVFILHRYRIALAERNAEVALPEALPTDGNSANRTPGVA